MKYYSQFEIENAIKNDETIIINDEVIYKMINGEYDNYIIREGLCGRNIENWDLSGLSEQMLQCLSFDSDTKFPKNLQEQAQKLLENSKSIMQEIQELQEAGITGKGVNIAIIDTPFDSSQFGDNLSYYQIDGITKENHGITVTSVISQIVPESQIIFFGDDKKSKTRNVDAEKLIKSVIGDERLKADVLSISSPVEIDKELLSENCEVINSSKFNSGEIGFRYGLRRNMHGNEVIEPADCQSEGKHKQVIERQVVNELRKMGIEVESINESNIELIINKLLDFGISENDQRLQLVKKLSKSPEEYNLQSIRDDKTTTPGKSIKNADLVCIPSAGITVKQNDGKFKYIGTNSTSFSIPVVTGLFAMARQVNAEITLEQFSEICRQTAKVENGYMVVSPKTMIREVGKDKEKNGEYRMCSKECFHFTNLDRLSSIKQYGLLPRLEDNSKAVKDTVPKVSFSDGRYAAAGLMADFYQVYCSIKNGTRDKSKTDPDLEKKVLSSKSFEEFLGDGMYLMFDGSDIENTGENNGHINPIDAGTTETIDPDKLKVCVLKDAETGEISYSKYEYAFYLMSNLTEADKKRLGDTMLEEIKKFQQDHLEIEEKFSKHAFSEEIIPMEEFQEIMKVRYDKKISIEDTVRNAITKGVATEDIKRVERLERLERTNDKNISEVLKDDYCI